MRPWLVRQAQITRQDLRTGLRALRRSPAFALTALITLTIGIGLNTTFFTLAYGLLFKPWPVSDPARVIAVSPGNTSMFGASGTAVARYRFMREASQLVDLVAILEWSVAPADRRSPRMRARLVSANYFSALGFPLSLGRGFHADEDDTGRPVPVAVIGDRVWLEQFARSPAVIGQTLALEGAAFTIVGVARPGATDSPFDRVDVWLPLASVPLVAPDLGEAFLTDPSQCCVRLAGRLRPGASSDAAGVELSALDRQSREAAGTALPARVRQNLVATATPVAYQPGSEPVARVGALVFVALLLMLLAVGANMANLQLARAMSRRRELAIRRSLGAGLRRIVRQLLTEATMLGVLAALLSLAAALVAPRPLSRRMGTLGADAGVDAATVIFVAAVTLGMVVLSSLGAALRGARSDWIGSRLRAVPQSRAWLLGLQMAASAVLVAGAGLLTRSVQHAAMLDPGFDTSVTSVVVASGAAEAAVRSTLQSAGIASPAVGSAPLSFGRRTSGVGRPDSDPRAPIRATTLHISGSYFETLSIRIRRGRAFTAQDDPADVVLNETLARRLYELDDAVGRQVVVNGKPGRVLGVVADARLSTLSGVEPTVFVRSPSTETRISFLLPDDPGLIARARAAAVAVSPPEVIVRVRPTRDNVDAQLAGPMIGASIASGIGLLALGLAGIGVCGVVLFEVQTRIREIGIRVALGARPRHLLFARFRQVALPLVIGCSAGLLSSLAAAPVLRAYLLGIGAHDPVAYAGAIATLAIATGIAVGVPARAAIHLNPVMVLRDE